MYIKNKSMILIIKDAQFFNIGEICKKLETPRAALEMINKGKELPKTFRSVALADLVQVLFLLEGAKEMGKKNVENP